MSENYFGGPNPNEDDEYGHYLQMTEESLNQLNEEVQKEDVDKDVVEPKKSYTDTISTLLDQIDETPEYQSFVNFLFRELQKMEIEDDDIQDIVNRLAPTSYSSN